MWQHSADHLIKYIGSHCNGHIFALGGLSFGAQIAVEALSKQADIAHFAVIESALACPIKGTKSLTAPRSRMSYGLIKKRWFSKLQARELCVPEDLFEQYYSDSIKMSKQSLVNTIVSNGTYELKAGIKNTKAKTLVIVGEKEIAAEKKSAQILYHAIPESQLYIAPKMKHGELSLAHPEQYVELLKAFFKISKQRNHSGLSFTVFYYGINVKHSQERRLCLSWLFCMYFLISAASPASAGRRNEPSGAALEAVILPLRASVNFTFEKERCTL